MIFHIETLKRWGTKPRVHPNGFIQLDQPNTNNGVRLHIWPTHELPKQGSQHPIHDHIFDMSSQVLKGEMINRVFAFDEDADGSHELHTARYNTPHDSTLLPTGRIGNPRLTQQIRIAAGGNYFLPAHVLHESVVEIRPTVTLMSKVRMTEPHKPYIAVPVGMAVDNDYSRHAASEEYLWELIEASL